VVIGLFSSPDHAAVCLSNLAEADFSAKDLSVVMKTPSEARNFAETSGRLNAVPAADLPRDLIELGVSSADAMAYRDGILQGGVFVAVDAAGADDVAQEMLKDHGAQNIRMLPGA
jgi:hypothetical protein